MTGGEQGAFTSTSKGLRHITYGIVPFGNRLQLRNGGVSSPTTLLDGAAKPIMIYLLRVSDKSRAITIKKS
ncbi:MAG TPA: hypothetical protein DEF79_02125 [Gammaproteobacteria bacterium]|nr:hypothetical protein [Gammaproteobacteria bacterium]